MPGYSEGKRVILAACRRSCFVGWNGAGLSESFALISRPIFTSKGVNTSALYGFTQTLLEIMKNQQPTRLAVVFDTEAPTQRHKDFQMQSAASGPCRRT